LNIGGSANIEPSWSQVARDVPPSSTPQASIQFLENAYQTCISQHNECSKGTYQPKRLIDISGSSYRLIEPEGRTLGIYAALSYSWGDKGFAMTKTETYEERKLGFPKDIMPTFFRDAAMVARSLDIKYLWVDTLCIIQDSKDDWEEQSANMGDIFQSAAITIAASSLAHPGVSLFSMRKPHYEAVEFCSDTKGVFDGIVFKARKKIMSGIHAKTGRSLDIDPLDERAWALQEKLLSTRLIAFTGAELQWTCQRLKACECQQRSYPTLPLFSVPAQMSSMEECLKWSRIWSKIVEEYSCRNLKQVADKLPALSGLASKFGSATGFEYVAGLWKETLMYDLSWQCDLGRREASSTLLGPSFSWVSINGGVNYRFARHSYSGTRTYHTEIVDVQYTAIGHGPYSRAAVGSSLTMRGSTVLAILQTSCDDPQEHRLRIGYASYTPCTDQRAVCEFSIDVYVNSHKKGESEEKPKNVARIGSVNDTCQELEKEVLLLSLYSIQFRNDIYQVFLILETSQHNSNIYERIGIGTGKIYGGNNCRGDVLNGENVLDPFQWLSDESGKGGRNVTKQEVCIQ
jgi:hypothetical protein